MPSYAACLGIVYYLFSVDLMSARVKQSSLLMGLCCAVVHHLNR